VITVVPVLFLVLCIVGTVMACVLVKKYRKKVYEVPNYAPPPFNPGYGTTEPPPEYSTVVKQ